MRLRTIMLAATLAAATALAGCQTSAIDTLETAAVQSGAQVSVEDNVAAGKMQFRQANYGLAEQHFRRVVEQRADNAEAWLGLAASYDQLGRFDFADRAYDQLLRVAGRRPEIVNNLGYSHYLRGDKTKARELYQEARRGMSDPTVVDANLALL